MAWQSPVARAVVSVLPLHEPETRARRSRVPTLWLQIWVVLDLYDRAWTVSSRTNASVFVMFLRVEGARNRGEFCQVRAALGYLVSLYPGSNVAGALLPWLQKRGPPAGISNLTL